MEKQGTAKILEEIGVLLELKGENPFKSRAYFSAARIVEMMGEEELKRLVREDMLKEVRGIGAALDEKLKELVLTGSMLYYDQLKASIPGGLLEILKVPGLGPRKARTLYEKLEIGNLAELEYACRENRLVNLKGFGPKSQANILEGIEFIRRYDGNYFFSEAQRIAKNLLSLVNDYPGTVETSLAGSIRRSLDIVKDIDLVASSTEPGRLAAYFSKLDPVAEVIAHGETKVSVRLQEGITADLRVVKPAEFPFALHHFTGSKEHNTALRHRAKAMGIKINEYGLFPNGEEKSISCKDETAFFKALGMAYIPPELRENNGEIEAAAEDTLPELVQAHDIRGLFHIHTLYSDGANTLKEVASHCLEAGYEYIGITDHSQSAFYAGGLKAADLARQREEILALREQYPGIGIFCGVEADIRADGSLDYPDEVLENLDFVIASVHSALKMERSRMTERLLKALSHPLVTMLGHPTNRLLLGRDSSSIDLEAVFQAALEHKVILELNASPARLDLDWRHLKKARDMGLLISINPDAHRVEDFGDTNLGVAVARKGWLEKNNVFNTRSRREVDDYFYRRRRRA